MIGTSVPQYIFIRTCIVGLRAITPLSIFYCSFSIAEHPVSGFRKFLLGWSALETAFWLLVYLPRKRSLQSATTHPSPLEKEQRKELFWKCWDRIPNPEYYLSRWFLGAKSWEIRRENVREFYRWALLNKGDQKEKDATNDDEEARMKREELKELDEYVDGVQTLLGRTIEPGRGSAKCLRLTVDEINMFHRPVLWYMIVFVVDTLTSAYLAYSGYSFYRTTLQSSLSVFPPRIAPLCSGEASVAPGIAYWYRPHTSKTRSPILFIHGISMGLYSYARFLTDITNHDTQRPEDGDIGIIAIEILPISFRITQPILERDEICRQIDLILERHGFDKVVLASHSYGSVITTHLLQNANIAAKIGSMLFIDPVTFLLHLPDVAYNFTARKPRYANEYQLHFFASTDMMVAETLARHFFWAQNILWKDELRGRNVTVSLGGRDLIVDTNTVGKYLAGVDLKSEDKTWAERTWQGHGLETVWWPTCDHAQVFERPEGRAKLGDILRTYCENREDGEMDDLP